MLNEKPQFWNRKDEEKHCVHAHTHTHTPTRRCQGPGSSTISIVWCANQPVCCPFSWFYLNDSSGKIQSTDFCARVNCDSVDALISNFLCRLDYLVNQFTNEKQKTFQKLATEMPTKIVIILLMFVIVLTGSLAWRSEPRPCNSYRRENGIWSIVWICE